MGTNVLTAPAVPPRSRDQISRDRATAKAHEQARAGNLPTLLRCRFDGAAIIGLWSVGSRTTGGTVYTVDLIHDRDGVHTLCDCQAAEREAICWHRAAARLAHADEIASHNTVGYRFRPQPRPAAPHRPLDQSLLTGRRPAVAASAAD